MEILGPICAWLCFKEPVVKQRLGLKEKQEEDAVLNEATCHFVGALPTTPRSGDCSTFGTPTKSHKLSGQTAPPSPDDCLEDWDDEDCEAWPSIEPRPHSMEAKSIFEETWVEFIKMKEATGRKEASQSEEFQIGLQDSSSSSRSEALIEYDCMSSPDPGCAYSPRRSSACSEEAVSLWDVARIPSLGHLVDTSSFFGVQDFSHFRSTCRVFASTKALVNHLERLLGQAREEVFVLIAESAAMNIHGYTQDVILQHLRGHPHVGDEGLRSFQCIQRGISTWWKAEPQSVLRIADCVQKSCSRRWKCFNAPLLRTGCAQWAFEQGLPCKSLLHLFVRDLLEFLEDGDASERLYACETLLSWKECGLGRFQHEMMFALLHVALIVKFREIPIETRSKALQALVKFLPKDAAQQGPGPDLLCDLRKYRELLEDVTSASTLLLDLDTLIERLTPQVKSETVPLEPRVEVESVPESYSCGCFTM